MFYHSDEHLILTPTGITMKYLPTSATLNGFWVDGAGFMHHGSDAYKISVVPSIPELSKCKHDLLCNRFIDMADIYKQGSIQDVVTDGSSIPSDVNYVYVGSITFGSVAETYIPMKSILLLNIRLEALLMPQVLIMRP